MHEHPIRNEIAFDYQEGLLLRCLPAWSIELGANTVLVHFPGLNEAKIMPRTDAELLLQCSSFRTLAEHVRLLASRGIGMASSIRDTLGKFVARGYLTSCDSAVGLVVTEQKAIPPSPGITTIAIPTRGRPDLLMRCLKSVIDNAHSYGHRIRFLVAEDSVVAEDQERSRSTAELFARHSKTSVFFLGRKERQSLVSLLAGEGLPKEIVAFALLGAGNDVCTVGAARNGILLHTAGTMFLSIDDDVVCDPGSAPGNAPVPRIVLGNDGDYPSMWSFRDRAETIHWIQKRDIDLLSEHERMLGLTLRDIATRDHRHGVDPRYACSHILSSLLDDTGQVCTTMAGAWGDSGFRGCEALLYSPDLSTRLRLGRSEASLQQAMASREVVRHLRAYTVSHAGNFMGMSFGLDNRSLLPPYFPVYRGEDDIFGILLERCMVNRYSGHLPFALLHDPSGQRKNADLTSSSFTLSAMMAILVATAPLPDFQKAADIRLRRIGEYLCELARLSVADFYEAVRRMAWNAVSLSVQRLESIMSEPSAPQYYRSIAASQRDRLWLSVTMADFAVPEELRSLAVRDAIEVFRSLVSRFGTLLNLWTEIVGCARQLADAGRLPGQFLR